MSFSNEIRKIKSLTHLAFGSFERPNEVWNNIKNKCIKREVDVLPLETPIDPNKVIFSYHLFEKRFFRYKIKLQDKNCMHLGYSLKTQFNGIYCARCGYFNSRRRFY